MLIIYIYVFIIIIIIIIKIIIINSIVRGERKYLSENIK